ncbi:hypothetical protein [Streptomyces sp. NBC_00151]|uniref:hypothetical protein n=1 Tax=Streptomyces sp. NBC_00151 TaxID=2975669 RepID=UPI002DDBAC2A|nr:hypothetical protein [Streptomyces sp. NBC_00151]WRZ40420.1 hypothetical protein OG915_21625 [Streptomyces sp. NBC_00151]
MDRNKHVALADAAVTRAERLAGDAETAAKGDARHKAAPLAAVGSLWAAIADSHTRIARLLPDTTPEA